MKPKNPVFRLDVTSNIARPQSYKTKTTYFSRPRLVRSRPRPLLQAKTDFFKGHHINNPRPQQTFSIKIN